MERKNSKKWGWAIAAVFLLIYISVVLSIPEYRLQFIDNFHIRPKCHECGHLHTIHDYYEATGISRDTWEKRPAEVKDIYGEPERISVEVSRYTGQIRDIYVYDGFGIIFGYRDPSEEEAEDSKAVGFALYSPDIKIRRDIHVGSTRQQITRAYWKCPSLYYYETNHHEFGDHVYDIGIVNFWENGLDFTYDEKDIVTSIEYYP